jgi:ABC-2 type transport system permease protein
MNFYGVIALYKFELSRFFRTILGSLATPVISTSLYFIVFGSAMGSQMSHIDGVPFGAFIVPGLLLLSVLTESLSNASFGIYLPRFTGTIYEVLSAPLSAFELLLGYVGAAATKSLILGIVILATARVFVPFTVLHPLLMLGFLILVSISFCLLGFILGVWATGFEKLQIVPMMVVTPLTFLGGSFYSISMLPPFFQKLSLFNPIVYLISGFRWTFYGVSDFSLFISFFVIFAFISVCLILIFIIFRTGYRIKS